MNIQEKKHYIITHWDTHNKHKEMRVWTDTVTETTVKAHVSSGGYPGIATCVWGRQLTNTWTWTEEDEYGDMIRGHGQKKGQ